ncbi:MAG: beta-N-acetylhexosaminidase [Candidatus Pacebacteria bacterium]|jgi:beta-N-acetylhexosaminidase|nr:beta-N-acetylhexosaminidase [Candidatus Paceibacterota bacterium]
MKKFSATPHRVQKSYFKRIILFLGAQRRDPWPAIKLIAVLVFAMLLAGEYFGPSKSIPAPATKPDDTAQKVGQMLMIGFRGTDANQNSYIAKAIKELNLGGVILFDYDVPSKTEARNITSPEQTKKLVANLKSHASSGKLLVAVDAEGGKVNRLDPALGFADIPAAKELGKAGVGAALESYWTLARQLAGLGFNINFGPVVDVDINPKNPVIGALGRSYSVDPERVAALARAFVAAHRSFGVLTSLKHFPGHGSSASDSHLGLADVTETYDRTELAPYEQLIKENAADAIMSAHIIDQNIDPELPATLSPKFIDDILRKKLGFDGVVFSDDMDMGAIVDNYGFEDSIVRAINAGCDILIFSNNDKVYDETAPYRARDAILNAVKDGRISRDRVDQAYARITKLKEKLER